MSFMRRVAYRLGQAVLVFTALACLWALAELLCRPARADDQVAMDMVATSYCPCRICCGRHAHGVTALGTPARGAIVAVDPRVIPLGTLVEIDGSVYRAEDTGRLIKGRRIDILRATHRAAKKFGRQRVKVTVLA